MTWSYSGVREHDGRTIRGFAHWQWFSLTCGLVVLILAACSDSSSQSTVATPIGSPVTTTIASPIASPPANPTASPVPTIVASPTLTLDNIVWTTAINPKTNAPTSQMAQLSSSVRTIYATIHVSQIRPGTVFTAKWIYNDTSIDQLTTLVTATNDVDDAWIEFHITRDSEVLWPTGSYEISIAIGDREFQTGAIEVVADDTP